MAIPTPKTPNTRNGGLPQKKSSSVIAKKTTLNSDKKTSPGLSTKRVLPTPPSREQFHQERKIKRSSGSGFLSTLLSILILCAIGFGVWTYKDTIITYLQEMGLRDTEELQQVDDYTLFVGKEVSLTGTMESTKKSGPYTYILQHERYGMLGLRSSSLNLKNFSGAIQLGGKIVDYINDIYIIDVNTAQSLTPTVSDTGHYIDGVQYITPAGLIVGDMRSDGLLLSEGGVANPNIITITNTITSADLIIRYFTCDESVSRNCKRFAESFEKSVGIDFVDSFGNTFYKLADGNTRFVSLDHRIGMYIETKDPTMVPLVIRNIQFVTTAWAKKTFTASALSLCSSSDSLLASLNSISLVPHDGEVAVQIVGTSNNNKSIDCLIAIDPKNSLGGKVISVKEGDEKINDSDNNDTTTSIQDTELEDSSAASSVPGTLLSQNTTKQFPLKPGKEISFSSRGNTIIFPSPSISYSSFTPTESIGGLKCSVATKVINYANKANLSTSPDIILYGCANGTPKLDDTMRSFAAKGMTYIVKVNNPAWVDFANSIKVE